MNNIENTLTELIEINGKNSEMGLLGSKMIEAMKKAKEDRELKERKPQKEMDLEEKIAYYRTIEDNKNLLWLDYGVWKNLPSKMKNYIKLTIDPLIIGIGVYLPFDKFIYYEEITFKDMDCNTVYYIVKEGNLYRMIATFIRGRTKFDKMNIKTFDTMVKFLEKYTVRTYSKPDKESIIQVKVREIEHNG